MTLSAFAQIVSSAAIILALVFNGYQVRQVLRQTNFMQYDVFGSLVETFTDQWIAFFLERPSLLAWFLRTRGYETSTFEENQRRLYALAKLNVHEGIFLQRIIRGLRQESWTAWTNVLKADLELDVFREVWPNGRRFYDTGFVRHVDRLLMLRAASLDSSK
jgi:hypothetical protein